MIKFGYFSVLRAQTYGTPLDPKGGAGRIRGEEFRYPITKAEINHPRAFYNSSDPDILRPELKTKK
ncbi:MAG TPA: hypothetical protein P5232_02265 [Candidatus Moranbacteria bacterium]|nr:hypothetical protein [Candidatus Moranbacteria bacterium]